MHTVSFGIPSYNEPENVLRIVEMINKQVLPPSVNVKEIIIVDDSDDERYNQLIKGFRQASNHRIHIVHNTSRRGVAAAWNIIFSRTNSDFLVLYDADVIIRPETTWRLIRPLLMNNQLGLVAACVKAISNSSISGMMSSFIADWLNEMRVNYPNSKYLAMGRGLAVRSSIIRGIMIPSKVISVDLYLQLYTLSTGFGVHYAHDAIVEFKTPRLLREAISQVIRGYFGHRQLRTLSDRFLDNPKVSEELAIAVRMARRDLRRAVATLIGYSLSFFMFSELYCGSSSYLWDIAETSK